MSIENIQPSEGDFVSKFLTLSTLSDPILPKDYQKPLQEVTSLGVALPALRYKYEPNRVKKANNIPDEVSNDAAVTADSVSLILKSIRAPKFTAEHKFSSNDTVLQVKQFLVNEKIVESKEQLKLLLKGKVLHDKVLLSDLNVTEATLNVMVSKAVASTEKDIEPETPSLESVSTNTTFNVPWEDIESLLLKKWDNKDEASNAVKRMKSSYESSK